MSETDLPNQEQVATEAPGIFCHPDQFDWSDPAVRDHLEGLRAKLRAGRLHLERPESLVRCFVETKAFLYDRRLYDPVAGHWGVADFLDGGERFGGFDQVILWPSYPRLGVDDRSQFDYFHDLPPHAGPAGPEEAVRHWSDACHARGVRVLLAYNPWDRHTRNSDRHLDDILELLDRSGADGIYLDTMDAAPPGWPEALACPGRPTVPLESEGDPSAAALPDVHSSWGQGYVVSPPSQLYRTRWLFPCHKIFLTCDRHSRDHWDEICAAFFTGTGIVVWENVFGNDTSWLERDAGLLTALAPLLRAFYRHFANPDWQPFVPSGDPRLKVNRFDGPEGLLHTIYWPGERDYDGPLFEAPASGACVDLITGHALLVRQGKVLGRVAARSVAAVLHVEQVTDDLRSRLATGCPGRLPAFAPQPAERIPPPSQPDPRLARRGLAAAVRGRGDLIAIPPGRFLMRIEHPWHGSTCYPHHLWPKEGRLVDLPGFAIDRFPVTNGQFAEFLEASGYRPADPRNFLRHWSAGRLPPNLRDHPVVYVSLDDARAYAAWGGKRLPAEAEWQYAAGGPDGLDWPWGDAFDPDRANMTGRTQSIGQHAADASPFGLRDLVGHVWQWLDDTYTDKMNRFTVLKGGSFWRLPPEASRWYLHTGPLAVTSHAKIALLSDSTDRFATVGFRCVADESAADTGGK